MDVLFEPLKPFIAFDKTTIDNIVFRFHTDFSALFLLTASLIVTAEIFIGDPINCAVHEIPAEIMDTYCWIHSTFVLTETLNQSLVTAHPGVGAIDNEYQSKDDVFSVKYYQWVCFTLFLQAIMFYLPKVTWKRFEGGRMARLIPPALIADPEHYDSRMPHFPKPKGLIPECDLEDCIRTMRTTLRLEKGKSRSVKGYFWKFLICEAAAFVNVIFQIFFTDVFLGGRFIDLGIGLWKEDNGAFPKVGKCTFRQFGPSGTVQTYDGICVLAVNIINAKIYVLFWFWLALLTSLSFLQLFYRVAMISCESVRKGQLRGKAHNLLRPRVIDRIVGETGISEFFLLNRIGANLNPWVFAALLEEIDRSLIAAGGYSLRNGIPHYNYPRNGQICHLGQMEKGEKTS